MPHQATRHQKIASEEMIEASDSIEIPLCAQLLRVHVIFKILSLVYKNKSAALISNDLNNNIFDPLSASVGLI